MALRLITGILLSIAAVFVILFSSETVIKGVVVTLCLLASYELATMILTPRSRLFAILFTASFCFFNLFSKPEFMILLNALMLLVMLIFIFNLFTQVSLDSVLSEITRTLFIILYLGLGFSFIGFLRQVEMGWAWLLLTLVATFAADTGAFFSGKIWGKHKLAPRVSPGKTIEGLLGGIVLSITLCILFNLLILKYFSYLESIGIALVVGLIGPLGDLSVSLIKRSVGVKDSGKLIPGHGGILDRVDALLFTAPVVYGYATFVR